MYIYINLIILNIFFLYISIIYELFFFDSSIFINIGDINEI
jgi:hypothetical protein